MARLANKFWFRIKFGLIITIIVNGLVVGRRQGLKLTRALSGEGSGRNNEEEILRIRETSIGFMFLK